LKQNSNESRETRSNIETHNALLPKGFDPKSQPSKVVETEKRLVESDVYGNIYDQNKQDEAMAIHSNSMASEMMTFFNEDLAAVSGEALISDTDGKTMRLPGKSIIA